MLMLSRAARTPACLRWSARPMKSLGDAAKEQPHLEKTPITSQLWERRKLLLKIGDETTPVRMTSHKMIDKTVGQSRMEILYNFTEDASLRHLYVDCNGEILMGKLFEDLDALAGNVAAVHCDDGDSTSVPLSLVTASVDKITQMKKIDTTKNYVLIGQMAFVGNSSMDILIQMQHSAAASSCLLRCFFTYVAKDPFMGKSVSVNRLIAQTPEEQVLYDFREKLASTRRSASIRFEEVGCRSSLTSLVERGSAMADMPALAHPNAVLMSQTELENCFLCQPQNVNTAGAVFGGFLSKKKDLLRSAFLFKINITMQFIGHTTSLWPLVIPLQAHNLAFWR